MKNIIRFTVGFLLVFVIVLYYGCCILNGMFSSSALLIRQAEKNQTASLICESLNVQFEEQFNKTAVPAEIYMNVITPEWVSGTLKKYINHYWLNNPEADFSADYTVLEKSITAYFDSYAAMKNYPKDAAYEAKLADTINNAERLIDGKLDIYNFRMIRQSGILAKLHNLKAVSHKMLIPLMIAGLVCVVILAAMKKPLYWTGTSLFAAGAIFTVMSAFVKLDSGIFADQSTGELVIGCIDEIRSAVMISGAAMIAVSVIMLLISILMNKENKSADSEEKE